MNDVFDLTNGDLLASIVALIKVPFALSEPILTLQIIWLTVQIILFQANMSHLQHL